MRQVHQFLRELLLLPGGHHEFVHQDVIKGRHPHGAGEAQVTHLDGGRPQRQDLRPRSGGIAFEVHQDVYAIGANSFRGVLMGELLQVHEGVEGIPQSPPGRAAIVGSIGVPVHAKPCAVMQYEKFGGQVGGGMFLKVG